MSETVKVDANSLSELLRAVSPVTKEATPRFKEFIQEVLASLSWSPSLVFYAPYQSALSMVRQIEFIKTAPELPTKMSFAVAPIRTSEDSFNEFEFQLVGNETWFVRTMAYFFGSRDKSLAKKLQNCAEFEELEKALIEKYEEHKALTELYSIARGIIVHEASHLLLAHIGRSLEVAKNYGLPTSVTKDSSPKEIALFQTFVEVSNIINDAFINEGIKSLYGQNKSFLENRIRSVLSAADLSFEEFEFMYRLDAAIDFLQEVGKGKESLSQMVKSSMKQSSVKEARANAALLATKVKTSLLSDFIEEDIYNVMFPLIQEASRKKENSSRNSQAEGKATSSANKQSPSSGNQQGEGQPTSSGQGFSEETVSDIYEKNLKSAQAAKAIKGALADGDSVVIIIDENGNIIGISSDTSAKSAEKTAESVSEISRSIARKAESMSRSIEDSLDDEERQRFRGFGSVFGRSLSSISEKKFHWASVLQELVKTMPGVSERKSWLQPVRSLKRLGYHYPGDDTSEHNKQEYYVIFMSDASGSMSNKEVAESLGVVLSASSTKIQKLVLLPHDSSMYRISPDRARSLRPLLKNIRYDKKLLSKYGVLAVDLEDARRSKKRLLKVLEALAKDLPSGGTSHVTPLNEFFNIKYFQKQNKQLSGIIAFTDCESDLENITPEYIKKQTHSKASMVIVNSNKCRNYRHPYWMVVTTSGVVQSPSKVSSAGKRKKAKAR